MQNCFYLRFISLDSISLNKKSTIIFLSYNKTRLQTKTDQISVTNSQLDVQESSFFHLSGLVSLTDYAYRQSFMGPRAFSSGYHCSIASLMPLRFPLRHSPVGLWKSFP